MNLQYNLATSNNLTQPESWNRTLCKVLKLTNTLFLMIYAGLQKWFNLADMQDALNLFDKILFDQDITDFDEFDPVEEKNIKSEINELIKSIRNESKPTENSLKIYKFSIVGYFAREVMQKLQKLTKYKELLNHPVYFNEYKDKYNNTYIQAKAFIKDKYNKKKWFSAYVGPKPENSKKNEFDPETIKKGRILIRKKLVDFYK